MDSKCSHILAGLACLTLTSAAAIAQAETAPSTAAAETAAKIQWFGNLEQALKVAKRTQRPILMSSAAPQCGGVPGMW